MYSVTCVHVYYPRESSLSLTHKQINTSCRAYAHEYIQYRCAHTRINRLITSSLSARQIFSIICGDKGNRQRVVIRCLVSSWRTSLAWNSRAQHKLDTKLPISRKKPYSSWLAHTCILTPTAFALPVLICASPLH